MRENTALIVLDLNNDSMPGGRLGIETGDAVVPIINELAASAGYEFVVAPQDWHRERHSSFKIWPVHCVAGTKGAELHPDFNMAHVDALIRKGYDQNADSYSGFFNEKGMSNGLEEVLHARGIEAVDVVGLATDYCVKETAIHAATRGSLRTRVPLKGCRGVGPNDHDITAAIEAMRAAWVEVIG